MEAPRARNDEDERLARIEQLVVHGLPFNVALGVVATHLRVGEAELAVPFVSTLGTEDGALHPSVVTALLDATCAAAVLTELAVPQRIATLDLRIDRMERALPARDVRAKARVLRRTLQTALVEGVAYHDDENTPLAKATATFALLETRAKQANEQSP